MVEVTLRLVVFMSRARSEQAIFAPLS